MLSGPDCARWANTLVWHAPCPWPVWATPSQRNTTRQLLVTGTGGSGTHTVTIELQRVKLDLGHEALGPDGILETVPQPPCTLTLASHSLPLVTLTLTLILTLSPSTPPSHPHPHPRALSPSHLSLTLSPSQPLHRHQVPWAGLTPSSLHHTHGARRPQRFPSSEPCSWYDARSTRSTPSYRTSS